MKRQRYIPLLLLPLLFTACSDHLFDDLVNNGEDDTDGIQFAVNTVEMADLMVNLGGTRAAVNDSSHTLSLQADHFVAHPLTGDNPHGLQVHRMPLPYMGIHRHAMGGKRNSEDSEYSEYSDYSDYSDYPDHSDTRAAAADIVSTDGTNFHDSLTIWGCVYDPTNHDNSTNHVFLFEQTLLKKIRNWRSSVQWPYGKGKYMRFCAVSPAFESIDMQLKSSPQYEDKNDGTEPTLTPPVFIYTLPETAAEMRDVLFGSSDAKIDVTAGPTGTTYGNPQAENLGKDNKFVHLTFQHGLTAIRFAKGVFPDNIAITKIELQGVCTKGTFNPATLDAQTGTNGAWSEQSGSHTYAISPKGVTATIGSNVYVDGDSVFFMIPQTLSSGVKLNVTLTETLQYETNEDLRYNRADDKLGDRISDASETKKTKTHTLSCSLSGDVWKKGHTVTYKLTIGELEDGYYLIAESPDTHEHSTANINGTFTVHSYRSYFNYSDPTHPEGVEVKTHAVNWKVADEGYSTDETTFSSTNPGWITVYGTSDNGAYLGGYGATAQYTITAESPDKYSHATILTNNVEKSEIDLSNQSPNGEPYATRETANCYIVNRRGSYRFPLVYGNKTSDGAELPCFKDHTGTTISHRFIKDQLLSLNTEVESQTETTRTLVQYNWENSENNAKRKNVRAVVLWQDVEEGLITNLTISPLTNFDTENKDKGIIQFNVAQQTPGNAVIALQAEKVTMNYTRTITGGDGTTESPHTYSDWTESGDPTPSNNWETLWTWHIWMTDEVYPNDYSTGSDNINEKYLNWDGSDHLVTLQNKTNETENKILPVNLGWVPDDLDFWFYSPREVWVKLEQVDPSGTGSVKQSAIVKFSQHARQPRVTGTSTVYQWGRPTAFPNVLTIGNVKRTIYNGSNADITNNFQIAVQSSEGDAIGEPYKLLRYSAADEGNSAWFNIDGTNRAYWSTTSKTIYDPCPPGFQMPSASVFTGMSRTGETAISGENLNIYPDVDGQVCAEEGKGGYFYRLKYTSDNDMKTYRYVANGTTQSSLFYMPATGEYQGDMPAETKMVGTAENTKLHINTASGIYWMGDYTADTEKYGTALWFHPKWSYIGDDTNGKRAIDFGRTVKYSSALPVRPTGALKTTE